MKRILLILIISLLYSCGARKVEKKDDTEQKKTEITGEVKIDIEKIDQTTIEERTIITDSTREEIEETEIIPADPKKDKVIKRKIKRFKAIKNNINKQVSNDVKEHDKTAKTSQKKEQTKKTTQTKGIDKKPFNMLNLIWVILILIIIVYLYIHFKKFIS